ncbi:MAG: hypothetical protein ACO363_09620, partial [Balneolaceae bacterium]
MPTQVLIRVYEQVYEYGVRLLLLLHLLVHSNLLDFRRALMLAEQSPAGGHSIPIQNRQETFRRG